MRMKRRIQCCNSVRIFLSRIIVVLLNYGKIYELKIIHVQKRLKKNFRNNFDERYK